MYNMAIGSKLARSVAKTMGSSCSRYLVGPVLSWIALRTLSHALRFIFIFFSYRSKYSSG